MDPPEDVCTTLRTPAQRAASASLMVPTTFTDASNWGSATECRTSIWAARWNTTSGRCSSRMACRSAVTMSASTKTNPGLSARCSRLVARPDAKLSRPTTEPPSAIKRSTSVDPMNPAAPVTSARTGPPYRRASGVAVAAAALIALQLVIRGVLAFRGYFYWDDLILIGRAGTHNLLSAPYLFDDHDGHLMPAAYLVAGAIARLAPLDRSGDQPGGVAAAGLAGVVARAASDPGLAAGTAGSVDVRALHPAGCSGFRVVGGGAELAADAGGAGLGLRRCRAASAYRQPALRGDGPAGLPRRPAVLREGGGDSVRGVRRHGTAVTCPGRVRHWDRMAPRCPVVDSVAGADRRLDRGVPRRGRSAAVEHRCGDDVGSVAPLGDPRHRAGPGRWAVGVGPLGTGLAVGHTAAGYQAARLGS